MASWTDELVQFNPYIQELPVEDMARVGMAKQEQYNRGVQQVQGIIDSIAGLNIANETQKQYLNARLGQLTQEVGKVAGADFSKAQLVGSIQGLAGQIANDKIIRNAVASTAKYQSGLAKMEKARTDGKSNPANEWAFQSQAEQWLNSTDVNAAFNGDYTEFYDIDKALNDVINEVRKTPGSTTRQNPYKLDAETGQYVVNEAMIEEEAKGVSPQKIRDAVARVMQDPRAQRQLQLNGQYQYRSYDKKALFEENEANYKSALESNQKKVAELTIAANNGTEAQRKTALAHIKEIEAESGEMIRAYNKDIDVLDKNPEAFKVALYGRNVAQSAANTYSYVTESTKVLTNPLWSSYMDMLRHNLDVKEYELDVLKEQRQAIEAAKKPKPGDEDSIFGMPTDLPINTEQAAKIGRESYMNDLTLEEHDRELEQKDFIYRQYDGMPKENPYVKLPNGEFRYRSKESGDEDSPYNTNSEAKIAAAKTFLETKNGADQGTTQDPKVTNYFRTHEENLNYVREKRRVANQIEKEFEPTLKKYKDALTAAGVPEIIQTDDIKGKFTVSAVDLLDMSIIGKTGVDDKNNEAKKRIISRIGESGYERLRNRLFNQTSVESSAAQDPLVQTYNKIQKAGISDEARQVYDQREQKYKQIQNEFINTSAPFVTDKPEQRRRWNREFRSVIQSTSMAGGGLGEGVDVDDILELLDEDVKEGGKASLVYSYTRDQREGKSYLLLGKGDGEEVARIPITDAQASRIPQVELNDPFYQRFGKMFLGGNSTDKGEGRATAFNVGNPSNLKNYNVKVHLDDMGGQYAIRMFIFDKNTGKWENNVPLNLGLLTRDQVMAAVNNISDAQINQILKTRK
jgi:hypothetical protein